VGQIANLRRRITNPLQVNNVNNLPTEQQGRNQRPSALGWTG